MENPEEILHSLEEFSKLKPKDIPRELEDYLCFVAKTGDPVYQWSSVKGLFREKLISVITEFYESCPTVEIPPCPNVEMFNYDSMKNFILEKLDTFAAAPFTVQRISELLTTPRKEYNRIDKYMRALEKNILVVSTTEPANRRNTENGEGIVNGIETEHLTEANSSNDINVEEMDDTPSWPKINQDTNTFGGTENGNVIETQPVLNQGTQDSEEHVSTHESRLTPPEPSTSNTDSVITCTSVEKSFVSIEPVVTEEQSDVSQDDDVSVTITAIPAPVQKRRDSIEPLTSEDNAVSESVISDKVEEEPIKETVEDKSENPDDEGSKTEVENDRSPSVENDNVSSETDTDEKDPHEKHIESENIIEQISEAKDNILSTENQIDEPTPNCVPQNKPETQETCDNTRPIENSEDYVDDSNKESSEAPAEVPETNVSIVEPIQPASTVEHEELTEVNIDKLIKETSEKEIVDNIELPKEIQSDETPMEVDSDEATPTAKESDVVEVSTVETNPN